MIVHIGYEKAGSTWLQQYVFPSVVRRFLWLPNQVLMKASSAVESERGAVLRQQVKELAPDVTLVSSEIFSSGIDTVSAFDFPEIIQQAWPDARIAVVLRSPYDLLRSKWVSGVVQNHRPIRVPFQEWLRSAEQQGIPERLIYDGILRRYIDRFGTDHVHPIRLTALGKLRGERFRRKHIQRTGIRACDLQRRIHGLFFGDNSTTKNERLVRMWLAHNRALGPVFDAMLRVRPLGWIAKGWLWYGRRVVTRSLEWIPSTRLKPAIPEWFTEKYAARYDASDDWIESVFGSETLGNADAWLDICKSED